PPCDCNIFVPDEIGSVDGLMWEACPYMSDGCVRAGAPWLDAWGDGYGAGQFEVTVLDGHEYVSVHRVGPEKWTENLLLRDRELIGMWRARPSDPSSQCFLAGPFFGAVDRAVVTSIRTQHEF